jgi:hypothetical protein
MFAAEIPKPSATPNSAAATPPQTQVKTGTCASAPGPGVSRACCVEGTSGRLSSGEARGGAAGETAGEAVAGTAGVSGPTGVVGCAGPAPASAAAGDDWANAIDDRATETTNRMASPRRKVTPPSVLSHAVC